MRETRAVDCSEQAPWLPDFGGSLRISSGVQIAVIGARHVGKSTVSQLMVTLLARRGLPVALVDPPVQEGDRPGDPIRRLGTALLPCPGAITVCDTGSWQEALALQVHHFDQVVVVSTPDVGSVQFAVQATRLVRAAGADRVHLVVNQVTGTPDIQRMLEGLARVDPADTSQFASIHTLPKEPGVLSSDVSGWARALRDDARIGEGTLVNAMGWVVDALVPALVGSIA